MPTVPAGNMTSSHAHDARMLAQQQVRLLGGLSRLLSRLLHSLLWQELTPAECRRALALLSRLDSDLVLALSIARGTATQLSQEAYARPS